MVRQFRIPTSIPSLTTPAVDPETGVWNPEWARFFSDIQRRLGDQDELYILASNTVTPDEVALLQQKVIELEQTTEELRGQLSASDEFVTSAELEAALEAIRASQDVTEEYVTQQQLADATSLMEGQLALFEEVLAPDHIGASLQFTTPTLNQVELTPDSNVLTDSTGVPTSRVVGTGTGLTGGGDLSADRTLSIDSASSPTLAGLTLTGALSGTSASFSSSVSGASLSTAGSLDVDGSVSFGTHSALSGETVTGYITITDSGGASRKLAVVS